MNFVQHLEECLRDLAAEARKKHPGVKEASERATLKLRSLQAGYVSAVRKAASNDAELHPTTALFQSSDLLHPFLLAANYPNADYKLLEISFRAMRLLMEADAVVPTDGIHMVRVYQIQAHVVTAYYQKHYAKEIQKAKADEEDSAATETTSENTSSGWFSWGSSSSSNTKSAHSSQDGKVAMKNIVSSSTGQTGQAALSGPLMEKLALEILSSLLQLMELLRNYPSSLTVEMWTNSVSLACLWLQHYLPARHTVQQAAHSTVSQIISLLYQTAKDDGSRKLIQYTWEDLLALTESERKRNGSTRAVGMQGAFKMCKRGEPTSSTAVPPSPEFALELMTQIWKERSEKRNQFDPSDALIVKSMGMTMNLLQKIPKQSVEKSLRVVQWTLALFQSHANTYPNECRELFLHLIKQIPVATDACRKHHDFEDGYIYGAQGDKEILMSTAVSVPEDSGAAAAKELSKRKLISQSLATVFPLPTLWKAGFVLEAAYHILDKDSNELSVLFEDKSTIQGLAEALSDFATIGTSCQDHILQVVAFCQMQNPSSIKPTVFRKAEQALASGSSFSDGPSSSKSADKKRGSAQILGEAVWLALQGILRISDCLLCIKTEEERQGLLEEMFSPSLALLQHFLKRIVGCDEVVQLALKGYSTLADICLPMEACSLQRKVLLTSLSKLSLPSWGKHDSSCLLQNHHVRSLLCLLRIVHLHFDFISADWDIILWTFEELSVLSIASPLLSDEAYHASLAISAAFARFASFSTCFSDSSIIHMTEALSEICKTTMAKRDVVGDSDTVLPERTAAPDMVEKESADGHETIGGKIINIGVRALYGSTASDVSKEDDMHRVNRTKNPYYQDYQNDFLNRISTSRSRVRTSSLGRLPFSLMLLADIAMANLFRGPECRKRISTEIYGLAAASPAIRPFVMDTMTMMIMCQLSAERDLPLAFEGRGRLVFRDPMHSQLLAVESVEATDMNGKEEISQAEVIAPLCESIQNTKNSEVAKSSLGVLTSILEGTGQNLHGEVWSMLIDAIASLSGDPSYLVDRSSSEWSACCLMAFRALKLIVDDFLEQLPSAADTNTTAHISLFDCCSSFAASRHDINTSLTAIGLLWTIADQDSDSAAVDRALSKLVLLSSDDRPEVRNAAVNTLFSCIVGRGAGFTSTYWNSCITDTIFGVYNIVAEEAGRGALGSIITGDSSSRYSVSMHHSRDSAGKMWIATQVLVLRGLARVLRAFFTQLLDTTDTGNCMERGDTDNVSWFQGAWLRILKFASEAASQDSCRDNLDIRSVGVEVLVLCCQLASKAGIQAAVTPARVSTSMEVVNGALRSVRESQPIKVSQERKHSAAIEIVRQKLFLEAFDSLVAFDKDVLRKLTDPDDTDIQILNRFSTGLSQLYDCCRGNEFKVDSTSRSLQALCGVESKAEPPVDDNLETRFVGLVVSTLAASIGDPKSRFLNQGERSSLDLLRSIASDGSSVAFEKLVYFAGGSFFIRKDSDSDGSESGEEETGTKPHATLLNFEAASAISQEILKDSVSDACRLYVLYMILAEFLDDYEDRGATKKWEPKQRRYYKRLVPVIRSALESSTRLEDETDEDLSKGVTLMWDQMLKCLSRMLTPIPLGNDMMKIARVHEVLEIVNAAISNVPKSYTSKLCENLLFGAMETFEAAKQHALNAQTNPESDFGRKSKRHRDDLLKLFSACFSGSCALEPEEPGLSSISEMVLKGALSTTQDDAIQDLCTDASLLVCKALQENQKMEPLVISIFPTLCHLVVFENKKLRDAAGAVLTSVNIAETLQQSQTRYRDAERRAAEAEGKVKVLQATVEELRFEKASLQKKVKRSDSGRGLWSLG